MNNGTMNDESIWPPSRWQDQLLPVETVLVEEDVAVLRQEVEIAHQLLQYQQTLIDSLTEQLVSYEAHQAQIEKDLEGAEARYNQQADKIDEVNSICLDLRSQIRRQQDRIDEYKLALKQNTNPGLSGNGPSPANKVFSQKFLSLGYETIPMKHGPVESGASPVSPWSATDPVNVNHALAICRKLAALHQTRVASAAEATATPDSDQDSPLNLSAPQQASPPASPSHSLELPSFVQ
ncbi:MAG: hypothetical protein HC934_12675 [Acaryochloridaceae cyanobacterium SU_2_1]|nr:hypothetical protein [Acaryochloridaceae cyanobacterium SU_2_1]